MEVRVVVLGDDGVGKTSLVAAAANEEWCQELPDILPPTMVQVGKTAAGARSMHHQHHQQGKQQGSTPPAAAAAAAASAETTTTTEAKLMGDEEEGRGNGAKNRRGNGLIGADAEQREVSAGNGEEKTADSPALLIDTSSLSSAPLAADDKLLSSSSSSSAPSLSSLALADSVPGALRRADVVVVCYAAHVARHESKISGAATENRAAATTRSTSGSMATVASTAWERDNEGRLLGGFERLRRVWLPLVRRIAPHAPIVLAGTKLDLIRDMATEPATTTTSASGVDVDVDDEEEEDFLHVRDGLLDEFRDVEACFESSSRMLAQVAEVVHAAHSAVVYPRAPLIDATKRRLSRSAVAALAHIFHAFDRDSDGLLSDEELNAFQVTCYNAPLQREEIAAIKRAIVEQLPNGVAALPFPSSSTTTTSSSLSSTSAVPASSSSSSSSSRKTMAMHMEGEDADADATTAAVVAADSGMKSDTVDVSTDHVDGAVTLRGFLFLHSLFLDMGCAHVTWTALRIFGYTNALTLRDDLPALQVPKKGGTFALARHGVIGADRRRPELSSAAISFLSSRFHAFDRDGDGALSPLEMSELFFSSPRVPWRGDTWEAAVESGAFGAANGGLTRRGFVAQWSLMAHLAPGATLRALCYLGYAGVPRSVPPSPGIVLAAPKTRRTLVCWVIGAVGSGKTEIVRGLAGRGFGAGGSEAGPWSAHVLEFENSHYTLCMREIVPDDAAEMLRGLGPGSVVSGISSAGEETNTAPIETMDVALFVYDSSSEESFRFASEMLALLGEQQRRVPVLVAAAMDDKTTSSTVNAGSAARRRARFFAEHDVALVLPVSMRDGDTASIYLTCVMVAVYPELAIPETEAQRLVARRSAAAKRALLYTAAAVTAVGALAIWAYMTSTSRAAASRGSTNASDASSSSSSSSSVDSRGSQ